MRENTYKRLPAKLDYLPDFIGFVSRFFRENGFAQKQVSEIELATEEALVNIFSYAYPDRDGDIELECVPETDDLFRIEIRDFGMPFDVLSISDPDIDSDIDDRPIGGLGIFFIKKLVDHVDYRRENEQNILTLKILRNA